ncbi:MAG: PIG-L family deacetylase [Tissierellales bacterium]|nr:PIG-L family deacetylase [Tissierellales bacterium]
MCKNRILAIVIHPDDEFGFAGVLLRTKSLGHEVHMLCVTKGEAGRVINEKSSLLQSYTKAEIRSKEFEESCRILEADSISFLGMLDGESSVWDMQSAIDRLQEKINTINPTHIITFDENGLNGHPDHIAVSQITKMVLDKHMDIKWIQLTKFSSDFIRKKLWFIPLGFKNKIVEKTCVADGIKTKIHKLKSEENKKKMKLLKIYSSQFPDEKNRYYSQPRIIVKLMSKYESLLIKDGIDTSEFLNQGL